MRLSGGWSGEIVRCVGRRYWYRSFECIGFLHSVFGFSMDWCPFAGRNDGIGAVVSPHKFVFVVDAACASGIGSVDSEGRDQVNL
jgi:hypothetical protein